MPKKRFENDLFVKREAFFSDCRQYRYSLKIVWGSQKLCAFIGVNPSTADQYRDDPTLRRCRGFAESWGCGGLIMLNLFALRSTDPRVMKWHDSPIGERNTTRFLSDQLSLCAGPHIAAWGNHGRHMRRDREVSGCIANLLCLGTNEDGTPRHPLYIPADFAPVPFVFR